MNISMRLDERLQRGFDRETFMRKAQGQERAHICKVARALWKRGLINFRAYRQISERNGGKAFV